MRLPLIRTAKDVFDTNLFAIPLAPYYDGLMKVLQIR